MKIISWNVNGIRAVIKKGFYDFMNDENPDIICVQETKAHKEQVDLHLPNYPYQYWNSAVKKGYSGTAIFSKVEPLNCINDIGIDQHDQEGRVITLEFEKYYLITVYTPNSKRELLRLEYRIEWDSDFLNFVKDLEKKMNEFAAKLEFEDAAILRDEINHLKAREVGIPKKIIGLKN